MIPAVWQHCLTQLEKALSEHELNVWVRPLHANVAGDTLRLMAPNQYVCDRVKKNYLPRIEAFIAQLPESGIQQLDITIGDHSLPLAGSAHQVKESPAAFTAKSTARQQPTPITHNLDPSYTFATFVEGKSNQHARAAAMQVAENPGGAYNPLFLYGGTGLGKTHLMHAVGHAIIERNPDARVVYLHSERWVGNMVSALRENSIDEFKRLYRSVDALLIDDIQFFAGKERSQEEFFHTFNALLEHKQQVVMTCDRFPREIDGLEERLKSRFSWGLTIPVEPPELEERVAILQSKAEQAKQVTLPNEVAFFIAQRINSNVRDLEGALKLVIANSDFTRRPITLDSAREALRDLIALQDKMVTMENIQKVVAGYYKIRVADLHSKSRSRSITRPRQIAMALAKELTNHSLPEIGDAFGGRDHTTVLHATKKVKALREEDPRIAEDYQNLLRTLKS